MAAAAIPSSKVFYALLAGDIKSLQQCTADELRPFLPCLTRIALCQPLDMSEHGRRRQKEVLSLIAGIAETNIVKEELTVDFEELRQDAQKEHQLYKKLGPGEEQAASQSLLAASMQHGLAAEFEKSPQIRKFRLVLSEILRIMNKLETPFGLESSELFECDVFMDEVSDILCIAVTELPSLLPIIQVSESLLRLEKGSYFLCRLIANVPELFDEVITSMVLNGESMDEVSLAGRCRTLSIQHLCLMNPERAAYVQTLLLKHHRHPGLALSLALDADEKVGAVSREAGPDAAREAACLKPVGVVTLVHNIVIDGDDQMKASFAQYMKLMLQKFRRQKSSAVTRLRHFLIQRLLSFRRHHPQEVVRAPNLLTAALPSESVELLGEEEGGLVIDVKEGKLPEGGGGVADSGYLQELVDQMEIEISDHESGDGWTEGDGASKDESSRAKHPHSRKRKPSFDKVDFPPLSLSHQLSDDEALELMGLLHCCCALKVQAQMYLTSEETAAILNLIACTCPPFSLAGVQFVEVSLCVLLACPFLISIEECERAVVRWFQWLVERLPDFEQACQGQCSYGEMLLLMAIHLQENQLVQIESLISGTLHMKVSSSLRSGHFALLRQLFMKVFTEEVVCAHAVGVAPTLNLSADMVGCFPIHCMYQLIKNRSFKKHGSSVKDWIYKQICTVQEPLHPTLAPLLQEYVQAILLSNPASRSNQGSPSSSSSTTSSSHASSPSLFSYPPFTAEEVLMLHYLLLYQDSYLANLRTLLAQSGNTVSSPYGPSILAQIPMKQLLQYARQHQGTYSTLYPSFLRLTATHLPQLCLAEEWLREEGLNGGDQFTPIIRLSSKKINPEFAREVLANLQNSPSKALLLLTHLSTLPPIDLIPYTHALVSTLPLLLEPCVARRIQAHYLALWSRLNTVTPKKLWLDTVNALRTARSLMLHPVTLQNVTEDPLVVLRCDPRVFRCPPVFEISLRVLAAYTSMSRAWLAEHAHTQNCVAMATSEASSSSLAASKQQRDELCVALTATQESAVVQLLLEICLPTKEDKAQCNLGPQLSALREIQCLVCSYIHQAFIADPNLAKLVHFQGYSTELLPMMVSGVPSMHICLDFVMELFSQPQIEKQQFAVQLAAHVIHHYPLTDAMGVAKDIFKQLSTLANEIPAHMREVYFLPILPAIVLFCKTFPPLSVEATNFLVTLSKLSTPLVETPFTGSVSIHASGSPQQGSEGKKTTSSFLNSIER
ncbi:hypothetical protein EMCRGX_G031914 [Ephydatia muelleri]